MTEMTKVMVILNFFLLFTKPCCFLCICDAYSLTKFVGFA